MKKSPQANVDNQVKIKTRRDKFISFTRKSQVYMLPFFAVAILLIIVPIAFILVYSITEKNTTSANSYFDITIEKYIKLFRQASVWSVIGLSIWYGLVASLISIILAYPISYILAGINKRIYSKNLWIIITLPTWISVILKTIGLQCMFNLLLPSALGTSFAIIVGMVYLFLPFAIIPISNSLINQDPIYFQAALDLKASKVRAFIDIKFRYSIPGVISAFNIVFIQSVTTLVIVKYIGNGSVTLVSSLIEVYFLKGNDLGYSAAISVILIVLVLAILGITKLISGKFDRGGN